MKFSLAGARGFYPSHWRGFPHKILVSSCGLIPLFFIDFSPSLPTTTAVRLAVACRQRGRIRCARGGIRSRHLPPPPLIKCLHALLSLLLVTATMSRQAEEAAAATATARDLLKQRARAPSFPLFSLPPAPGRAAIAGGQAGGQEQHQHWRMTGAPWPQRLE